MKAQEYSLYNETPVIRTFTGKWFNVFDITEEMIDIEDIAHALSHQCRFGGHLSSFYSVAQHCVLTADLVHDNYKLSALMHDASEAYLLDIPRPIKIHLSNYKEIEDQLMNHIAVKYGFEWPMPIPVKMADEQMLQTEWDGMVIGNSFADILTPTESKQLFLNKFNLYYDKARLL